jgi:dTDP-4-dehydrorhamnose 3,5-epimerase
MQIEPIRFFPHSIGEAFSAAQAEKEPLALTANVYADDRGWSIMNQLHGVLTPEGQINYSSMYPGVIKAWHRHHFQTDFWICVAGHLKVGVFRDDGRAWQAVIGELRPSVVVIPPPLWHGCATVGPTSAGLIYYVTRRYDSTAPDEDRRAYNSVEGFPWTIQNR